MCRFQPPCIDVLIVIGRGVKCMNIVLLGNSLDCTSRVEFWHTVVEGRWPAARFGAGVEMHLKLMLGYGRIFRCWRPRLVNILRLYRKFLSISDNPLRCDAFELSRESMKSSSHGMWETRYLDHFTITESPK